MLRNIFGNLSKRHISFQYFSDIHIEKNGNFKIKKLSENCLIAGDIGNLNTRIYYDFLDECKNKFKNIFLTTGNHEYWGSDLDQTEKTLQKYCKDKNINYLQNNSVKIENYRIFGCTLWTHIPENKHSSYEKYSFDSKYISDNGKKMLSKKRNELHQNSIISLKKELEIYPLDKFIILTHHMPSLNLIDPYFKNGRYQNSLHLYATDQIPLKILQSKQVCKWIYGHTHKPQIQGKYHCNPLGYNLNSYRDKIFELK